MDSSLLDKSDFDYNETLPPVLELDQTDCFVPVRKATSSSTILTLPTPLKKAGKHPKSSGKVLTTTEGIRLMEEKENKKTIAMQEKEEKKRLHEEKKKEKEIMMMKEKEEKKRLREEQKKTCSGTYTIIM